MILKIRDEKKYALMRNRVFKHMLKTRGWKYRAFLRYLRFFKYAAFAPTRGEFLESYYVLMRFLDDVVDGAFVVVVVAGVVVAVVMGVVVVVVVVILVIVVVVVAVVTAVSCVVVVVAVGSAVVSTMS